MTRRGVQGDFEDRDGGGARGAALRRALRRLQPTGEDAVASAGRA